MGLSFDELRTANVARSELSFNHPLAAWSPADWAVAMAGECGEACNLVKKLRRQQDGLRMDNTPSDARVILAALAKELADVVIYADLLAARCGIDLGCAVAAKFDEVSERVGSPFRLGEELVATDPIHCRV